MKGLKRIPILLNGELWEIVNVKSNDPEAVCFMEEGDSFEYCFENDKFDVCINRYQKRILVSCPLNIAEKYKDRLIQILRNKTCGLQVFFGKRMSYSKNTKAYLVVMIYLVIYIHNHDHYQYD